jgi:hypothetical protein
MSLNRLTLVLNASYEPINVIGARRALTLVMGGKAHVEEPSGHCHRQCDAKKLTLDNVIPRCRGGGSTWENLVAACY